MTQKPKVLICVLCETERGGWVNQWLCASLLALQQDPRLNLTIEFVSDRKPVEHARNICVCNAREIGADACVQIDNDMTLPANFADIMCEAIHTRKAVVSLPSGIVPPEGPRIIPEDNGQPDGQFRQTGCAGGGVLIIHSEVWRTIPRGPWFRWLANNDEILSRQLGEDYFFCELLQQHGLVVWTHQRLAGHLKTANASAWILQLKRMEQVIAKHERKDGEPCSLENLNPPIFRCS